MIKGTVVLAFDFGLARIGVAQGNTLMCTAHPLGILKATTNEQKWDGVMRLIQEWQPSAVIVGVPRHPDGVAHEMTRRSLRFSRQLKGRCGLPVFGVDERYSSVEVEDGMKKIDDQAAAVILQQWFDEGMPERRVEEMQ